MTNYWEADFLLVCDGREHVWRELHPEARRGFTTSSAWAVHTENSFPMILIIPANKHSAPEARRPRGR